MIPPTGERLATPCTTYSVRYAGKGELRLDVLTGNRNDMIELVFTPAWANAQLAAQPARTVKRSKQPHGRLRDHTDVYFFAQMPLALAAQVYDVGDTTSRPWRHALERCGQLLRMTHELTKAELSYELRASCTS